MATTMPQTGRDPFTGQYPGTQIETKEFFRTSEFWAMTITVAMLLLIAISLDALDVRWTSMLVTILVSAYSLGRGFAKAGSSHPFWGREMHLRERFRGSEVDDHDEILRRIEARLDQLERTTAPTQRVTL